MDIRTRPKSNGNGIRPGCVASASGENKPIWIDGGTAIISPIKIAI